MHEIHLHDTRKKMQASSSVISILNKQKERKKHSMLKMAHSWKSKAGKKSVERKAEDEIKERAKLHRQELKQMETAMEKRVEEQKKALKDFEEKVGKEFQRKLRQHQADLKKKEELQARELVKRQKEHDELMRQARSQHSKEIEEATS